MCIFIYTYTYRSNMIKTSSIKMFPNPPAYFTSMISLKVAQSPLFARHAIQTTQQRPLQARPWPHGDLVASMTEIRQSCLSPHDILTSPSLQPGFTLIVIILPSPQAPLL